MFSLICAWINGWVNNRKAGDLRRHRAGLWRHCNAKCRICDVSIALITVQLQSRGHYYSNKSLVNHSFRFKLHVGQSVYFTVTCWITHCWSMLHRLIIKNSSYNISMTECCIRMCIHDLVGASLSRSRILRCFSFKLRNEKKKSLRWFTGVAAGQRLYI